MRAAGLRGATLRKFVVTTERGRESSEVADLVERRFYAERPNRLWVADATYIPTWSGFLYLAIVLDVFSRKIAAPGTSYAVDFSLHLKTRSFCRLRRQTALLVRSINVGRRESGTKTTTCPRKRGSSRHPVC